MRKYVRCPACGGLINQHLPDVAPAEAGALRAAGADERVWPTCPHCQEQFPLLKWDLPSLPDAPPPP
jgi:hypothetical protein